MRAARRVFSIIIESVTTLGGKPASLNYLTRRCFCICARGCWIAKEASANCTYETIMSPTRRYLQDRVSSHSVPSRNQKVCRSIMLIMSVSFPHEIYLMTRKIRRDCDSETSPSERSREFRRSGANSEGEATEREERMRVGSNGRRDISIAGALARGNGNSTVRLLKDHNEPLLGYTLSAVMRVHETGGAGA